jgi:DNA polymerase-3 subunit gamma/tau
VDASRTCRGRVLDMPLGLAVEPEAERFLPLGPDDLASPSPSAAASPSLASPSLASPSLASPSLASPSGGSGGASPSMASPGMASPGAESGAASPLRERQQTERQRHPSPFLDRHTSRPPARPLPAALLELFTPRCREQARPATPPAARRHRLPRRHDEGRRLPAARRLRPRGRSGGGGGLASARCAAAAPLPASLLSGRRRLAAGGRAGGSDAAAVGDDAAAGRAARQGWDAGLHGAGAAAWGAARQGGAELRGPAPRPAQRCSEVVLPLPPRSTSGRSAVSPLSC